MMYMVRKSTQGHEKYYQRKENMKEVRKQILEQL